MAKLTKENPERESDLIVTDDGIWLKEQSSYTKFNDFRRKIGAEKYVQYEYDADGRPIRPPPTPYEQAVTKRQEERPRFNGTYTITPNGNFRYTTTTIREVAEKPVLDEHGHQKWNQEKRQYETVPLAEDDPERLEIRRHDRVYHLWAIAVLDDRVFI